MNKKMISRYIYKKGKTSDEKISKKKAVSKREMMGREVSPSIPFSVDTDPEECVVEKPGHVSPAGHAQCTVSNVLLTTPSSFLKPVLWEINNTVLFPDNRLPGNETLFKIICHQYTRKARVAIYAYICAGIPQSIRSDILILVVFISAFFSFFINIIDLFYFLL